MAVLTISDRDVGLKGIRVPWASVPDGVPSIFPFSRVLVIPAEDTAQQQEALIEMLHQQFSATLESEVQVVWVLNSVTNPDVSQRLNFGNLVRLQDVESGTVRSFMPELKPATKELIYAFSSLPKSSTHLCYIEWLKPLNRVVVGASSVDFRWVLVPPSQSFEWVNNRWSLGFSARSVRHWVVGLAAVWILSTTLLTLDTWRDYRAGAGQIAVAGRQAPSLLVESVESTLDSRWINPGARMAARVYEQGHRDLLKISSSFTPGLSPSELWHVHVNDPKRYYGAYEKEKIAQSYFHLALLAGDLASAYEIINSLGVIHSPRQIIQGLTSTFWQSSLEYLHELDFERSWIFNYLYLESSQSLSDKGLSIIGLGERNRTLSHILDRELRSGRIKSLCAMPGVHDSFARLLGGEWGTSIPKSDFENLIRRRDANKSIHCLPSDMNRRIDYEVLSELRSNQPEGTACNLFPLECEYQRLQSQLDDITFEKSHESLIIYDILNFSASCSYLSDDLFYKFLEKITQHSGYGVVPWLTVVDIAKCLEESRGDYTSLIIEQVSTIPCRSIDWNGSDVYNGPNLTLKEVSRNCSEHGQAQ